MSFNLLSVEEPDLINNDQYYIDEVDKNYNSLLNYLESKPLFDSDFAKIFCELLNDYYDSLNDLEEILDEEYNSDIKSIYLLLDKHYSEYLLSKKSFTLLNDSLFVVDLYHNLYIHTKNIKYIFVALKYSSDEILELVDEFYNKTHRNYIYYNGKPRYKCYINTLYFHYKKTDILDIDAMIYIGKIKSIVQNRFESYFNKLFDSELNIIKNNWNKLYKYFNNIE